VRQRTITTALVALIVCVVRTTHFYLLAKRCFLTGVKRSQTKIARRNGRYIYNTRAYIHTYMCVVLSRGCVCDVCVSFLSQ